MTSGKASGIADTQSAKGRQSSDTKGGEEVTVAVFENCGGTVYRYRNDGRRILLFASDRAPELAGYALENVTGGEGQDFSAFIAASVARRRGRTCRSGLPIFLTSGFSGSWTLETLQTIGVRHFVPKPISAGVLAVALDDVLRGGGGGPERQARIIR